MRSLELVDDAGALIAADDWRWLGPADAEDRSVLARARSPVLDIGCGPGRHLLALAARGGRGLGLELTPGLAELARSRGVAVVEGSIFATVPKPGTWRTALLLDGNIGIGGDPVKLLRRVATLLAPGGRILVELGPRGIAERPCRARVEGPIFVGPWFGWTAVSIESADAVTAEAGLHVVEAWSAAGRWFAELATDGERSWL